MYNPLNVKTMKRISLFLMAFILACVGMQAAEKQITLTFASDATNGITWSLGDNTTISGSTATFTAAGVESGWTFAEPVKVTGFKLSSLKSDCPLSIRFMDKDNKSTWWHQWGATDLGEQNFDLAQLATEDEKPNFSNITLIKFFPRELPSGASNAYITFGTITLTIEVEGADTPTTGGEKTSFSLSTATKEWNGDKLTISGNTLTFDNGAEAANAAVTWAVTDISSYNRLVLELDEASTAGIEVCVLPYGFWGPKFMQILEAGQTKLSVTLAGLKITNDANDEHPVGQAIDLTNAGQLMIRTGFTTSQVIKVKDFYLEKDGSSTPATDESYSITIEESTNGKVTANKTSAKEKEEVTLTITPDEGYELDELTVTYEKFGSTGDSDGAGFSLTRGTDVGSFGTVTVTDNKFTMPKGNVTVKATFKEKTVGPTPPATYTLTVNKQWVTFCSPKTFTVPEGLKAYTVTAITQPTNGQTGSITLSAAQTIVEANVPMLIENTNTSTTSFTVEAAEGSVTSAKAAQYKGVTSATNIPADAYVLIDGTFLRTNGGSLPAYHCYIEFSSATTRSFVIEKGSETTAIQNIGTAVLEDDQWYTLNGIRVAQPKKGIYIRNGKKVVVR